MEVFVRSSLGALMIVGAILALLGIVGLAIPEFTTQHTEQVAKVGPVQVDATKHESHFVPPAVAGGALVLGVVLLGAGFVKRR
jgi:hypothetical protein